LGGSLRLKTSMIGCVETGEWEVVRGKWCDRPKEQDWSIRIEEWAEPRAGH